MNSRVPDLRPLFRECVPGFREEADAVQAWINRVFWACVTAPSKYTSPDIEFSAYLHSRLIRAIGGRYGNTMRCLNKYILGVDQGSNLTGKCNLYVPSPNLIAAYHKCAVSPGQLGWIEEDGVQKKKTKPRAAINPKTSTGGMRSGRGQPLSCLPIHRDSVRQMLGSPLCTDCQRSIYRLLTLSKASPDPATLPVRYIQHANTGGRLFEENRLQETTRRVRSVALNGMWDYDISNCHYTLIAQLASNKGLETRWINDYLANKRTRRAEIKNILEVASGAKVDEEDAKSAIIALAYGMSLYRSKSLNKIFKDENVVRAFSVNPWIRAIRDEVLKCRRALLEPFKMKSGGYLVTNALGLRQSFGARDYGRALSFLVTGVESAILDEVLQGWGSDVVLCIHDGWVSRTELPVQEIEDRIARQTGFRVTIEVDRISPETCDRCGEREKISELQKVITNHASTNDVSIIGKTSGGQRKGREGGGTTGSRTTVVTADPGSPSSLVDPGAPAPSDQLADPFVDSSQKSCDQGLVISNRPRWAIGLGYRGSTGRGGRPIGSRNRVKLGSPTGTDITSPEGNTLK